jgi:hypothetical protein
VRPKPAEGVSTGIEERRANQNSQFYRESWGIRFIPLPVFAEFTWSMLPDSCKFKGDLAEMAV